MELKQLNKITVLVAFVIGMNVFSQMQMADIQDKKFSVNLKNEKNNIIKILDNNSYSVFYILDRRGLDDFDKGRGTVDMVNLIFYSKKYNKGILTVFKQGIMRKNKSVYNITLRTGSHDKYMFAPSMIIVDKDFNYEYLMEYRYMHLPYNKDVYTSTIAIQNNKNYCNFQHIDLKGNAVYEDIDDILSNISKININENKSKECDPIISDEDLKYFFPKKIIK